MSFPLYPPFNNTGTWEFFSVSVRFIFSVQHHHYHPDAKKPKSSLPIRPLALVFFTSALLHRTLTPTIPSQTRFRFQSHQTLFNPLSSLVVRILRCHGGNAWSPWTLGYVDCKVVAISNSTNNFGHWTGLEITFLFVAIVNESTKLIICKFKSCNMIFPHLAFSIAFNCQLSSHLFLSWSNPPIYHPPSLAFNKPLLIQLLVCCESWHAKQEMHGRCGT